MPTIFSEAFKINKQLAKNNKTYHNEKGNINPQSS
jgi:hypothetical protein